MASRRRADRAGDGGPGGRGPAELYLAADQTLFLRVTADAATVAHPEHGHVTLPRGEYRVWKQREFTDAKPRPVYD